MDNKKKQYGGDYAVTVVNTMSHKEMTSKDVERVINASQRPDFKVHHEKIADVVYNTSSNELKILSDNCDQIETAPNESTDEIEKLLSSIRLSIIQRNFILDNLAQAGIEAKNIKNTKSQI